MISLRVFLLSGLSTVCLCTFLYYILFPQGPHLLQMLNPDRSTLPEHEDKGPKGSEANFVQVEKFDPE